MKTKTADLKQCIRFACRADKLRYRHDCRADNAAYPHDRHADSQCHSRTTLFEF